MTRDGQVEVERRDDDLPDWLKEPQWWFDEDDWDDYHEFHERRAEALNRLDNPKAQP